MGQARFPAPKDIDSFDFIKGSSVDENQIQSLYQGDFIEQHINLIFVGGTGSGRPLATAIAAQAVRDGKSANSITWWIWQMSWNRRKSPVLQEKYLHDCFGLIWSA